MAKLSGTIRAALPHRSAGARQNSGPRKVIGFRSMFEDLNYEELKRRANARLPERVVATLEARGERRSG